MWGVSLPDLSGTTESSFMKEGWTGPSANLLTRFFIAYPFGVSDGGVELGTGLESEWSGCCVSIVLFVLTL